MNTNVACGIRRTRIHTKANNRIEFSKVKTKLSVHGHRISISGLNEIYNEYTKKTCIHVQCKFCRLI